MKNSGFTLPELLITVAIIGILASIAVPSFSGMIERNHLKTVTTELEGNIKYTRTQAIKRSDNTGLFLKKISANAGGFCYGITTKASCDCEVANDCEIKSIDGSNFSTIKLTTATESIVFDFRRGIADDEKTITFATNNFNADIEVNLVGRVTITN